MTQTKAELLQTRHQGDLKLGDADSSHYVGFKSPATVSSSLVWTLPAADGSNSHVLTTNGSGVLSWSAASSGTTINNNANNRLITGSGTANTLEAESGLTWDGTNLDVGDDKKIRLGASQDFQLYHNNSNGNIIQNGSGKDLSVVGGNGFSVCASAGGTAIFYASPYNVYLRDQNLTTRLQTSTAGITITGTATATAFSGSGASLTNLPAAQLTGTLPAISGANLTGITTNLVSDTSPQLGGDLDVQTSEIKTATSNRNIKLNPHGTGVVEVKGDGSSNDGTIQLNCSQNSHGIKIKSPPHSASASYTFTYPNDIQNGKFLTTDGSGNTSWATPGGGIATEYDCWNMSGASGQSGYVRWEYTVIGLGAAADGYTNWYRVTSLTPVGNGMSESAGVWTFPSAGMWKIELRLNIKMGTAGNSTMQVRPEFSSNSGTSYTNGVMFEWYQSYSAANHSLENMVYFQNCTNATNQRFRFSMWNAAGVNIGLREISQIEFTKIA